MSSVRFNERYNINGAKKNEHYNFQINAKMKQNA